MSFGFVVSFLHVLVVVLAVIVFTPINKTLAFLIETTLFNDSQHFLSTTISTDKCIILLQRTTYLVLYLLENQAASNYMFQIEFQSLCLLSSPLSLSSTPQYAPTCYEMSPSCRLCPGARFRSH